MRIARILWILGLVWSVAAVASEEPYPAESSFIIRLADAAIDAEGVEAIADRDRFRRRFADSFLGAFVTFYQDAPTMTEHLIMRIGYSGQQAGYSYRYANPDSVERVMREYGYKPYEVVGDYSVKMLRQSYFVPENENVRPFRMETLACWSLGAINSREMSEQMQRLFTPEEDREGSRKRVRVIGFLGPLRKVKPGEESFRTNDGFECERNLYATSINEIARETK